MLKDGNGDLLTLLFAAILGVCLCVLYDVFRILRKAIKTNLIVTFIEDLLYFALAAYFTFLLLYVRTKGEMRWFVLLGEGAGFILCRCTLSRAIMAVSGFIIGIFVKANRSLHKWIVHPIAKGINACENLTLKILKKSANLLKKWLQPASHLLYNMKHRSKTENKQDA